MAFATMAISKARAIVFTALAVCWTGFLCLIMLWTLFLPKRTLISILHVWQRHLSWIERNVAGLDYRVIGHHYIPKGACIIAAKHQSVWETLKLHLLFGDPAIVLKKELMDIPVWGWYARRSGMIPVDRGARSKALSLMMKAAHEAADARCKIVIFPQGTRVSSGEWKPYKIGVAALYQELNLPIIPMALNSGIFWPKKSLIKKSGVITVEFLPPIPPGLSREDMMRQLQASLEDATNKLMRDAGGTETIMPDGALA